MLATSSLQYSKARAKEKERYTKLESRREKESDLVVAMQRSNKCERREIS